MLWQNLFHLHVNSGYYTSTSVSFSISHYLNIRQITLTSVKLPKFKLELDVIDSYFLKKLLKLDLSLRDLGLLEPQCNQDNLVQGLALLLSNCNWNYDVTSHDRRKCTEYTEWMRNDELLIATTGQYSSAGRPIFYLNHGANDFLQTVTGQSEAKYKLHHLPLECLEWQIWPLKIAHFWM